MLTATSSLYPLSAFHHGFKLMHLKPLMRDFQPKVCPRRWASSTVETKTTPLFDFHRKRGAKMEPFAGYLMPIVYKNQTIRSEHMQTRTSVSVFDVSHMMQTLVKGKDRHKFLESLTVADLINLKLNKCTLSLFTNKLGGIIDDCIITQREDYLHVVSNAGNADVVWQWLNKNRDSRLEVELERLSNRSLIALQGPSAANTLQMIVDVDLSDIEFMNATDAKVDQIGLCQVARCGYTGEDGFEISVESSHAMQLMEKLCQQSNVKPAGLGARDTLRLEAGLCLHGHEMTEKTTLVEAALNWTVHKLRREKGGFLGFETVSNQLKNGPQIKRVGLLATEHGPPAREGSEVVDSKGSSLGLVTSGTFSPVLEKNIAMAYLPTTFLKQGNDSVSCVIRGKTYGYKIVKMPFVKSNYYLKK